MKENDRYTSIIWTALGLYVAFEGYRLELGTFHNPKCGFLIFLAGAILSALSMTLFIQTFFYSKEEKKILWKGLQWSKGIRVMVSLFVYALTFRWLGFILSTFFLLLFLFKGIEPMKWRIALLLSSISIILSYLIFEVFLEFRFPRGILEELVRLLR